MMNTTTERTLHKKDGKVYYETATCVYCNEKAFIEIIDVNKCEQWMKAEILAQQAFPELPTEIREQLISGTHPKCWDEMFSDDEGWDEYGYEN